MISCDLSHILRYATTMAGTRLHLNSTTLKIFRLLSSGVRLSRNKHFDLFRDPQALYARRLHRLFSSLSMDLQTYGSNATVYTALDDESLGGPIGVQIKIPLVRGTRTVFLTAEELSLFSDTAPNSVSDLLATLARPIQEMNAS